MTCATDAHFAYVSEVIRFAKACVVLARAEDARFTKRVPVDCHDIQFIQKASAKALSAEQPSESFFNVHLKLVSKCCCHQLLLITTQPAVTNLQQRYCRQVARLSSRVSNLESAL